MTEKQSPCNRLSERAQQLDQFGTPFAFRLPDGRRDKRSWQGVCFSIVVAIAIFFYAAIQFEKLINYGSTTIMVSSRDAYFDTDFEFTTDDGLMIAFGLTAYDDNYEPIEDE